MLFIYILVLLFLVSLGLSISSFVIKKSNMKNLSTECKKDPNNDIDYYKNFIFKYYQDFLKIKLNISTIDDLGIKFCKSTDYETPPCSGNFIKTHKAFCLDKFIIYKTPHNPDSIIYCFHDINNIACNYINAYINYNAAQTKLKNLPSATDNFISSTNE